MKKSEIFTEALLVCEMACKMRKNIAEHKKQLNLETDEEVFECAPSYWDEELSKVEAQKTLVAEHLKEYTEWTFSEFWMKKMKNAVDFDKSIHFFPNKVIKFLDWARYSIDTKK